MITGIRRPLLALLFALALLVVVAPAAQRVSAVPVASGIVVSEVAPWSSGNSPASLAADWFELTNTTGSAITISGWKMDDNSHTFGNAVTLNGIASIAAGESVIFVETSTANPAASVVPAFKALWFGANVPAGLQVGSYDGQGAGVGLSTSGDEVNIYNGAGTLQAMVSFGSSPGAAPFPTFNNSIGLNNAAITQLSVLGANGCFAAANDAGEIGSPGVMGKLFISEVAPWSSGNSGAFGIDWFEVTNGTAAPVTITGWTMDDNSNAFANSVALTGITTINPGESVIFLETDDLATKAAAFRTLWFGASPPAALQIGSYHGDNVGLSTTADAVNLYNGAGVLQANVAFGASPSSAPFGTFNNAAGLTSTTITQLSVAGSNGAFAAANDANEAGSPGSLGTQPANNPHPIKINEVESDSAGTDWIELYNTSATDVVVTGFKLKDNNDANVQTLGTSTVPALGRLAIDVTLFTLDSVDSVRLYAANGTTLIDSFSWLEHSSTTYGRCVEGTGSFITNLNPTKGTANACPTYATWPGDAAVQTADGVNAFGENMSGLIYEGSGSTTSGVLWAVRNGPETLFRLVWNGTIWAPDTTNGWASGRQLRYTNGLGQPDSEGVTFAAGGSAGGIFVATERNNGASSTSRPAILRFDPNAGTPELTATNEWNLTADLPTLGANLGPEAITWVPDAFLVSRGFWDESKGHAYNPAEYPNNGGGIFFVGIENDGFAYAYAFDMTGSAYTRVATIDTGFPGIMELQFDRELGQFWAVCDNTCEGRSHILQIDPVTGRFVVGSRYNRPAGMPNYNNEGFAMASQLECVANRKPAFWTDDGNDLSHALRSGTVPCNDDDADGVVSEIDPQPVNATNESFSDAVAPFNGQTSGAIVNRNGKTLSITNAYADPAVGVNVAVAGAGSDPVQLQLTGKAATINLPNGSYVVTDPAATTTVGVTTGGPATITTVLGGEPITLVIAAGASVTYTETLLNDELVGFSIDSVTGNVTLNGVRITRPRTLVGPPENAAACKNGGWQTFNFPSTYRNQGDCIDFFNPKPIPDTTNPTCTLRLTPPFRPDGSMKGVSVKVSAQDNNAGSGIAPNSIRLVSITPSGAGAAENGWNEGTGDTSGNVATVQGTTYTWVYSVRDNAGNTGTCSASMSF